MPAHNALPVKVCPFCLVDARTDASSCAYCGSRYDRVAPVAAPQNEASQARRRTYDGTPHHGDALAYCVSLELA